MFGLENQRKKNKEFVFDLEKELKNPAKLKQIVAQTEERIQHIKSYLREGEKKEEYQKLGVILQGYIALKKVMNSANVEKPKFK